MLALIRFVFGAAIGSFLNVLALRYVPGKPLFGKQLLGRSQCPHCGRSLRWYELIPFVSFVIQRGTCRGCAGKISLQYPFVELAAGLAAAFIPELIGLQFPVLAGLWVAVFLVWIAIVVIDVRYYIVPDELNILLAALGVFIIVALLSLPIPPPSFLRHYAFMVYPSGSVLGSHLFGALAGGASLAAVALFTRGRAMGWGDVKLAAAGGLVLGLPETALALFTAFIAGGIFGGILLLSGRKRMKDRLPFAPFLVGGMAFTILFGYQAILAYFELLV